MSKKSLNAKKLKQLRGLARRALLGNNVAAQTLSTSPHQEAARRAINVAARSSSLRRALKRHGAVTASEPEPVACTATSG